MVEKWHIDQKTLVLKRARLGAGSHEMLQRERSMKEPPKNHNW